MIVAIPTYRRAQTLAAKTLPTLAAAGVPPAAVHVWVSDPAETGAYRAALNPAQYGQLRAGTPTLAGNRNTMAAAYLGQRVLFADDDLSGISQRTPDGKLEPVTDLPAVAAEAFALADRTGARLWGVYPVHNGFFMKPRTRFDLRYIIGCLYGMTFRGDPCEQVTLEDKEDYERTLRCYAADRAVVRLEYIAPKTRYYVEPGGMQVTRTPARIEAGARTLAARYPQLCTYRVARSGKPELSLRDTR